MAGKGGVSSPLMHCVFNEDGSITHYLNEVDPALENVLSNTYAICIADNKTSPRKVVGGIVAKTSYHHDDAGFHAAMDGILHSLPKLSGIISDRTSLLPAKLGVPPGVSLTEDEMLRVLVQQYIRLSASGSA
ncbi:hypothetical protein LH427_13150 [Laribacter hongkongensis]|uniref:hypothetical protein n=1 Tax=Laribacter hongkongensis TaxID=168471 RepID=UPI001EFCF968|nr:hypothetical protein [Laribacter hongkongensis]MCG8992773.1 hypothetical protein [Laribacter hongkongensis]MCG8998167.1 hypothetical protein [Laribacter hongkongensis]MCG9000919.1 hypothetical protein [Laribacter hongkongensis]MCG9002915.1 hypothetical protein [Laribacter hongkongensis]MCG9006423.1 hypothetical protein [Laribacter hongkongensis]